MAQSPLTSIRSNSMPPGGMTALQSIPPEQVPSEIAALVQQLEPVITRLRSASTPMTVRLKQASYDEAGASVPTDITSVGLGHRTRSYHKFVFNVSNTAASAQVVDLSSHFPFNLLANTSVQVNGGAASYSASGHGGLMVVARTRRSMLLQVNNGLSPALVRVTFGTGLTPTASSVFTFSGYASFSVAASTNNAQLTVEFITMEKLAYSLDTMLGALPLQNKSVNAQITRTLASKFVGATNKFPFYVSGGAPSTLTISINTAYSNTFYDWWSVPADPALYGPMVDQSYQILEQPNQTFNATGSEALVYDMPQNQYHIAEHIFARDNTDTPLSFAALSTMYLYYNGGSMKPVLNDAQTMRALNLQTYGHDVGQVPGYFLWDGDNTSDQINQTDDMGWVDAYSATSPQLVADVDATLVTSLPVTYSVIREAIAAGQVQVI